MSEKTALSPGVAVPVLLTDIIPSRWQARRRFDEESLRELALSIRDHGLINPPLAFLNENSDVELVAGERRWRASLALALAGTSNNLSGAVGLAVGDLAKVIEILEGKGQVPIMQVDLRQGPADDFHEIALVENLQREDITTVEEAEAFNALMVRKGWTQKRLAAQLGKSPAYVSQRLSLLDLEESALEATAGGEISFTTARDLSTLPAAVQRPVAQMVKSNGQGDDPASTRQAAELIAAARRFFEPNRWAPDPHRPMLALYRNRARLLAYHVEYLLANEPERAGAVIRTLATEYDYTHMLTMKVRTIIQREYAATRIMNLLTGANEKTPDPFWAAFAQIRGYTCENCRFSTVPAPDVPDSWLNRCPRWAGDQVTVCPRWIGPDDPVMVRVPWQAETAIKALGGADAAGVAGYHAESPAWVSEVEGFARAVVVGAEHVERQAEARAAHDREEWLAPITRYWQAQPKGGIGGRLLWSSWLAHRCDRCRHYRPDVLEDLGAPCAFAAEPLDHEWATDKHRAPNMALLVSESGRLVPRCEGFQLAAFDPADFGAVVGLSLPYMEKGIDEVLGWFAPAVRHRHMSTRNGAFPAPLAWLPYDRKDRIEPDPEAMLAWLRDHWTEISPAIGRLLSLAAIEAAANDGYTGSFVLMDPLSGELSLWADAPFDVLEGRAPKIGYPKTWPRPWEKEEEA